MNRPPFLLPALSVRRLFAPDGAGGGAGGGDGVTPPVAGDPPPVTPPPANTPPANDPPARKWFEGEGISQDEFRFLESKGLTGIEDPVEAAAKLTKFYRGAEQLIGDKNAIKGPAKDQPLSEWMKENAKAFGIPDSADGYKIDKPADWPKDLPWNDDLNTRAQALAFERGVPADMHKAYVGMMADYMKETASHIDQEVERARSDMMTELEQDWGQQTPAKITQAKQAMQHFGAEAGLSPEALSGMMSVMKEKLGDAATLRLFQAIGASMGEDRGVQIGKGGSLGVTPAEAKAQMAAMAQPGGKMWDATQSGDRTRIAEARSEMERLARIAAGT